MGSCDNCGTLIIFGGKRVGSLHFCSEKCLQASAVRLESQELAQQVPAELIQQQVWAIHQGDCPKCGRPGPVDVHFSYSVWSVFCVSGWNINPQVSCRRCAVKSQCSDTLFSLLFGWWGFPFGLVLTPIQVLRNLIAMIHAPNAEQPSPHLEQFVRRDIVNRAAAILATAASGQPSP